MDHQRFSKLFPLGSHLCREPMPPMSELERDMEILKKHGFNLIKLQEHWMIDEPEEGRCDFSRYEELIERAAALDLGVYLGLTCEQAPHWLYEKYPECRMVRRDGSVVAHEAQTTLPADGKPGPCCDHPGAMADQLRFISSLVERLGRFENIVVWNTWQEIGYWSEGLVGGHVCYCPNTMAAYRGWLKEKYGDLDNLNRAWNARYARWTDIVPDRGTRVTVCAQEIEWRRFMDCVQIPNLLRRRAEAVRAADPLQRPVFAHKGGPVYASEQDWHYARTQDFVGSSCYPAWGPLNGWDDNAQRPVERHYALLNEMWSGVAYAYDHIRCANGPDKPVWAAEFQGGPVSTGFHKGRVPSPEDLRRWMLTAVGSGVTALSFWVTRAEIMAAEVDGFSLLDSTGESTPRFAEAARVGLALNRHPDLFGQPTLQPAEVALLVNEENALVCSLLSQGGANLQYSTRGWYRLLWDAGIPVDLVAAGHLDDVGLDRYATVIAPFPLAMSERTAGLLSTYVHGGGNLISEACPGRIDENAFSNRGELSPTMAALFGVEQESFTMVREPGDGQRWSPPERTWGEYLDAADLTGTGLLESHSLRANVYIETYLPTDAETVLKRGDATAGTIRRIGDGTACLLGTFVGHSGTAYRNRETSDCLLSLLAKKGIHPQTEGELLLRKRIAGKKEAWLLTNPTADAVTETIDIGDSVEVEDLLDEDLRRSDNDVTLTVDSLDVRVLILNRRQ